MDCQIFEILTLAVTLFACQKDSFLFIVGTEAHNYFLWKIVLITVIIEVILSKRFEP